MRYAGKLLIGIVAGFGFSIGAVQADSISAVQKRLMFRSVPQDAAGCSVGVIGGAAVIVDTYSGSGASSCPDAFAWSQFANAVSQEFWDWATDETMWPGTADNKTKVVTNPPLPLCSSATQASESPATCCTPPPATVAKGSIKQAPDLQCPYFRADYSPVPALPSSVSGLSHNFDHKGLSVIDPGRFLRDNELEVVFRNRAFFNYVYNNDLYSTEGLASRNIAQNNALASGDVGTAQKLTVRFPVDAVMVKIDFIRDDYMVDLGLITQNDGTTPTNNTDFPYVILQNGTRDDSKGNPIPNFFYAVAMTNASKDLPIWHWYAIEHVANLGRCDYIGCNDSYGYPVTLAQGDTSFGTNFTPTWVETDPNVSDALITTGLTYLPGNPTPMLPGSPDIPAQPVTFTETPSTELQGVFTKLGIGTGSTPTDFTSIHADDPAWLSYRLKGTQTSFTGADGIPTGTGATVTEGGFVNSASCATCHSQASVNNEGATALQGVGATWQSNLLGFGRVAMGSPMGDWFYNFGGPSITATQIDFVWGILGANCQAGPAGGPCTTYYDAPRVAYEN